MSNKLLWRSLSRPPWTQSKLASEFLPVRYSSAQAGPWDEGGEAELGRAPLKEGSKSGCCLGPVIKVALEVMSRQLLYVGNVSNQHRMVKVSWFETQQSNESDIDTNWWSFNHLVVILLDSNWSLLRTLIGQKPLLAGDERRVSMVEMWWSLGRLLHCICWKLMVVKEKTLCDPNAQLVSEMKVF